MTREAGESAGTGADRDLRPRVRSRVRRMRDHLSGDRATAVLAWIVARLLRILGRTWRVTSLGHNPVGVDPPPHIGAFWHHSVFILAHVFADTGFTLPISRSRDGDLITEVTRHLGVAPPPRGSSTRGGTAALHGLVRAVKSGVSVGFMTDGPRGPARESKAGIVALSRLTQVPITPAGFAATPCIRFGSWDRTILPLPFAKVVVSYGEPLPLPAMRSKGEEVEHLRDELDRRLHALTRQSEEAAS